MTGIKARGRFYAIALGLAVTAGLSPALFNVIVDPYDMNAAVDLDLNKQKISEKAHYPLWKMARYPQEGAKTVILGDSRARALRNKYWNELGQVEVFNFAYGGATVHEIYDTFRYVKNDPKLRTLVVGIQLRSFDPDHKGGMNRVPEAIKLTGNAFDYYTSWFVAKVGWRHLNQRYAAQIQEAQSWTPRLVSPARATEFEAPGEVPLVRLLSPEACYGCRLPELDGPISLPAVSKGLNLGLGRGYGRWAAAWPALEITRELPSRFERQVRKNGRSDWKSFKFSEELWSRVAEMADWSAANGVRLIFVIPPTITEMQQRMTAYGHAELNHRFRTRLAALAPVVDFDFDNGLTRDLERFTDAYHFNSKAARNIVGELVQLVSEESEPVQKARKRRGELSCPVTAADTTHEISDGIVTMSEGGGCRIWRWSND
ncbi:hypothetical protein [Pelagibius sp. Alg239-R121]|uniref:hypothetical protein n=1 Tax=Pelagibius sp. Alg239-R121 TaxID=2993448 RepID=UPI0024A6BAEC|nr:hypothetical protein [Pelagibius sp. Alg239-R121]